MNKQQTLLGFLNYCATDTVNGYASRPVARQSDPDTSHAAAESITKDSITEAQIGILILLCEFGPATDEEIALHWFKEGRGKISASGLRTRRHELHLKGYVKADGYATLASGNYGTMWAITESGTQYLEGLATK